MDDNTIKTKNLSLFINLEGIEIEIVSIFFLKKSCQYFKYIYKFQRAFQSVEEH